MTTVLSETSLIDPALSRLKASTVWRSGLIVGQVSTPHSMSHGGSRGLQGAGKRLHALLFVDTPAEGIELAALTGTCVSMSGVRGRITAVRCEGDR
jgi:hypothetical protein